MSTFADALRELPAGIFADFLEGDDAYLLLLDLPGTTRESTTLTVGDGSIRIEADRVGSPPADATTVTTNRAETTTVELPIPPRGIGSEATATLERGVLELRVPKGGGAVGTEIPIEDD